jgi:hypothetical protein
MEYRYCESLSQFIDDDDGYDSDDVHESCRKASDYAALNLSFPSPPWSPCDNNSENDLEAQWLCHSDSSVIDSVTQQSEIHIACECHICALPGGPLIKDCMWSAGVAVPVSSTVCAAVPSIIPMSTLCHMLDSETAVSCTKEETDDCPSDDAANRAVCARLAQYHQTGTALQLANSSMVKTAKSVVRNHNRQCWVSEEFDYLLHSGTFLIIFNSEQPLLRLGHNA